MVNVSHDLLLLNLIVKVAELVLEEFNDTIQARFQQRCGFLVLKRLLSPVTVSQRVIEHIEAEIGGKYFRLAPKIHLEHQVPHPVGIWLHDRLVNSLKIGEHQLPILGLVQYPLVHLVIQVDGSVIVGLQQLI